MKELVEKITATFQEFEKEAKAHVENGNKAAGTRARKATLELEKLMKQFRKDSIEQFYCKFNCLFQRKRFGWFFWILSFPHIQRINSFYESFHIYIVSIVLILE